MSYVDGFVLPIKDDQLEAYRALAEKFAQKVTGLGATASVESLGDGLEHGKVTDFYRAVQADEGENVIFSFVIWPDKQTRDAGWEKLMADPDMQPGVDMPFDGKRMFWGGFVPIVNSMEKSNG